MEIFISKQKIVKGILLSALMTCASLYVAVKVFYILFPPSESLLVSSFDFQIITAIVGLVAAVSFCVFGAGKISLLFGLFQNEPQLIINLEGIEDKRLRLGLIEWNEIENISIEETKYAQWLNLELRSPKKFYNKLSKFQLLSRKLNGESEFNNFRVRFTNLDAPIDEAWNFIENNIIKRRAEKLLDLIP